MSSPPTTITFTTIPPSDETMLLPLLLPNSGSIHLRFERPKTLMREIARVVRCAMNAGIRVEEITANDFAILKGFEREPRLLASQSADGLRVDDVIAASYSVRFQPGCIQQMGHLCRFLFAHRRLRTLSVSLFEFPTEEFMNEHSDDPLPPMLLLPLPSMMGMDGRMQIDSPEQEVVPCLSNQLF